MEFFRPIRPNADDWNFWNHAVFHLSFNVAMERFLIISHAYDIRFYFSYDRIVPVFFVAEKRGRYRRDAPHIPEPNSLGIPRRFFLEASHVSIARNRNKELVAESARRTQKETVSGVNSIKNAKHKNSFFSFAQSRTTIICPRHLFQAADRARLRRKSEARPEGPPSSPRPASTSARLLLVPSGGEKSSRVLRC